MKRRRVSRLARGLAVALACALVAPAGQAQEHASSAADVSAARELAQEGTKLANSGQCVEAIDRLSRAEKLFHAPTTLARLGECQVKVGKVVEGSENLYRVTREVLPPNAPKVFVKAQERAAEILPAARARIAKLKVVVKAPTGAQPAVSVDGEAIPGANVGTDRPVDPGEHAVEATAPGALPAKQKVSLRDGETISITLTLEPDPNAPKTAVAQPNATKPSDQGAKPPGQSPSRVPAYAVLGVGIVGLGVGATFGVLAAGKKSDLDDNCVDKHCPETQESTLESAKTFGTVSTIGFAVGLVGVAAGVLLFVTSAPKASAAGGAPAVSRAQREPRPVFGIGPGGIHGVF